MLMKMAEGRCKVLLLHSKEPAICILVELIWLLGGACMIYYR